MPPAFRVPGVLNSQEMLVAEAIQARAWSVIQHDDRIAVTSEAAKARLGGLVLRLMSDRSKSIGDLAAVAVAAFWAQ